MNCVDCRSSVTIGHMIKCSVEWKYGWLFGDVW